MLDWVKLAAVNARRDPEVPSATHPRVFQAVGAADAVLEVEVDVEEEPPAL